MRARLEGLKLLRGFLPGFLLLMRPIPRSPARIENKYVRTQIGWHVVQAAPDQFIKKPRMGLIAQGIFTGMNLAAGVTIRVRQLQVPFCKVAKQPAIVFYGAIDAMDI